MGLFSLFTKNNRKEAKKPGVIKTKLDTPPVNLTAEQNDKASDNVATKNDETSDLSAAEQIDKSPKPSTSISLAISNAESKVEYHNAQSGRMIYYMFLNIMVFLLAIFSISGFNNWAIIKTDENYSKDLAAVADMRSEISYRLNYNKYDSDDSNINPKRAQLLDSLRRKDIVTTLSRIKDPIKSAPQKLEPATYYITYGILIFVIGILSSFYRQHQKESSKYESYAFALHRIRIAAYNSQKGYEDDIRAALIKSAFTLPVERAGFFRTKEKVESPIPGHPSSDALTAIFNKMLDTIEIFAKKEVKP